VVGRGREQRFRRRITREIQIRPAGVAPLAQVAARPPAAQLSTSPPGFSASQRRTRSSKIRLRTALSTCTLPAIFNLAKS
jgi:hypothetical protein